jgi:hypothetical protein
MEITTTSKVLVEQGLKILVHGPAGAGKTRLCSTTGDLDHTLIISAEGGLLSIKEFDIDVVQVRSLDNVYEVFEYLRGGEHHYRWVCLDSISEIAEVVLQGEKLRNRDARRAYGEMADTVSDLLRGFRNLPYNVLMTAKQGREEIDGRTLFAPMLPGRTLTQNVAYLFDEVFALRVEQNSDGEIVRVLQTGKNRAYEAKDRSGRLSMFEEANLSVVAAKISGLYQEENEDEEAEEGIQENERGQKRVSVGSAKPKKRASASASAPKRTPGTEASARRANIRRRLYALLKESGLEDARIVTYMQARCEREHGVEAVAEVAVEALERWAIELETMHPGSPGERKAPRRAHCERVLKGYARWKKDQSAA